MYREPPLSTERIAGRRQTWRAAGTARGALPLVLLHGIGSNARAWAGQFAGFDDGRRVIAWNAPGYAGSAPLPSPWPSPDAYAAALAQLLDHLDVRRCVLVGQSLGAVMATAFALGNPDRVASLVLASPARGYGTAPGGPLPERVAERIADIVALGAGGLADARYARLLSETAGAEAHAIVRRAMAEVDPHGYTQAARLLATADLPRAVVGLQVPVTTIWGSVDRITPPESCAAVAAATPGGQHMVIPGGGHAVATECPEAFNQALRPLLAAADARERKAA